MKSAVRARMVKINKISKAKNKDGVEVTVVYFTVADRSQTARKNPDGTTTYLTKGFYFCKARGTKADLIIRDFGQVDANGKLISRAIYLDVEPQFYKADREIDVEMVVPADTLFAAFGVATPETIATGATVKLNKKEKVSIVNTVYFVKEFEYDDYKPKAVAEVTITVEGQPEAELPTMEEVECMENDFEGEETATI